MSRRLIILGASGHGKVAADIAIRSGYEEILFLDDNPEARECLGWPVVGRVSEADGYQGDFFVAIGNPTVREMQGKGQSETDKLPAVPVRFLRAVFRKGDRKSSVRAVPPKRDYYTEQQFLLPG